MRHRFPFVFLLLLALIPAGTRADDTGFFIEKVDVRNLQHVSPEVVLAEARLHEGRTYSESELHDAANRVRRLPFIIGAELSLEKGSERGRYVLVLKVIETRLWFFQIGGNILEGGDTTEGLEAGHRWFLGSSSEAYASVGTGFNGYGVVNAGLNRYNLFGRGGLLNLNVQKEVELE